MDYANQSLSELAISIPMASEIFRKNRLDFCCGGKQTLKEACEKRNLSLNEILSQLEKLKCEAKADIQSLPLPEITKFIVQRYHDDLRNRFPELIKLSSKVEKVHAEHVACPRGLTDLLQNFYQEMLLHMMKEENVLFPLIESGRGSMAMMPVKVMTAEHDSHGKELQEIHRLTWDFTPPVDACATWKALFTGLEKLEEELMNHIHLENNILFPRALMQGA